MKTSAKLVLFDYWFRNQYQLLKQKAFIRTPLEEDSFHDAYLKLRRYITFCDEDIVDYTPYFVLIYRSVCKNAEFREKRYVHPDDFFFRSVAVMDESEGMIYLKQMQEKVYVSTLRFVKETFPMDYHLFCLKVIEPCCSYRELQLYAGISAGVIRKKIEIIKETIKKEFKYETSNLQ